MGHSMGCHARVRQSILEQIGFGWGLDRLWLTGPAWQGEPTASVAAELQDEHATMEAWSVAQLSDFLEQEDLHGPAKHLRANGVRGADLLRMNIETLVADVGLTRFAAARVISVRDAFT